MLAWQHGSSLAAFLLPGLALWLPSGYSWSAVILLVCALICWPCWRHQALDPGTKGLTLAIVAMMLLWAVDTGPRLGLGSIETAAKYLAAVPCLWFVVAAPPRPSALWAGLAVGGMGSGVLAIVQRQWLHLDRAHGFLNAVQYGDLSLLIGVMALGVLVVLWSRLLPVARLSLAAGGVLGWVGSLLSQTRGGWLAIIMVAAVVAAALVRRGRVASAGKLVLALSACLLLSWALLQGEMTRRLALVHAEVSAYIEQQEADTSIGQRLDHWQLAARMGVARPLLGWGSGYEVEKARRVKADEASEVVLRFEHAHNELLDMFARRGLLGVLVLMFYMLVPLVIFWPTARRVGGADGASLNLVRLALCLTGIMLPLSYIGFGLTQVLFAHNSGHIFYLFMLLAVQGTLVGMSHAQAAGVGVDAQDSRLRLR